MKVGALLTSCGVAVAASSAPQCSYAGQDPYAPYAGDGTCCDNLAKVNKDWNGDGNYFFKCCFSTLDPQCSSIVGLAESMPTLSTLVAAVVAADLVGTLSHYAHPSTGTGSFTVFAPTNAAFAKLGDDLTALLLPENKAKLVDLLGYHVLSGAFSSRDLQGYQTLEALEGKTLTISLEGKKLQSYTGDRSVEITLADQRAGNGVVHIIDGVLLPSGIQIATGVDCTGLAGTCCNTCPAGYSAILDVKACAAAAEVLKPGKGCEDQETGEMKSWKDIVREISFNVYYPFGCHFEYGPRGGCGLAVNNYTTPDISDCNVAASTTVICQLDSKEKLDMSDDALVV